MQLLKIFGLSHFLATMDLKDEAFRFRLGFLWWLIEPLLFVLVFYVVFSVFFSVHRENFLAFLFLAKIPYLWFSKSISESSTSLISNRAILSQCRLNIICLPIASVLSNTYRQLVILLLFVIGLTLFGQADTHSSTLYGWLLVLIVFLFLVILFFSLFAAFFVSFFSDVSIVINMGMMLVMFMSGIFWSYSDFPNEGIYYFLKVVNPLALFVDSFRGAVLDGAVLNVEEVMLSATLYALLTLGAFCLYYKRSRSVAYAIIYKD